MAVGVFFVAAHVSIVIRRSYKCSREHEVVTAKVVCNSKLITGAGEHRQAEVKFAADNSPENKAWSLYTPALSLSMTLKGGVADRFEPGQAFTVTFEPSE